MYAETSPEDARKGGSKRIPCSGLAGMKEPAAKGGGGVGKNGKAEREKKRRSVSKRVVKCNLKKEASPAAALGAPLHPILGLRTRKEGRKFRLVYNSARIGQLFRTLS